MLQEGLNSIPGYRCQPIDGAMYAFPSITLPPGKSDDDYCMALLEQTGVCVVAGVALDKSQVLLISAPLFFRQQNRSKKSLMLSRDSIEHGNDFSLIAIPILYGLCVAERELL